jgi:hypothetical protein
VRGAPALAGDLALFFRGHRSKTASFLANTFHSHPPGYSEIRGAIAVRPPRVRSKRKQAGYKADASPAENDVRLTR